MDFKSLRYVIAVAESGTISAAAKTLGISQPSLSKYLFNLDDSLGVKLFNRSGGKLAPTYAGERYLVGARQILDIAVGLDAISSRQDSVLRISCPPFEGAYIHPAAIQQFCEKYPGFRLTVLENNDGMPLLQEGQADLAITNYPIQAEGFVSGLLVQDEVLLVSAANHPVSRMAGWKAGCKQPWVDVNLLRNEPFIQLFPDQSTRRLSDELLRREHIEYRVLMQTRSTINAIRVAATGAGVCFVPETGIRGFTFPELPAFFSVGDPLVMDVCYTYNKNHPNAELIEIFINLAQAFL
ncbi:LysR family transcriptional regulator [Spirochaetia bacterium]|nr:LysR family transcriptional regulator [Spirochaetia bacterium]